jgi:predicted DNA-binding transcriptional regulator YafY
VNNYNEAKLDLAVECGLQAKFSYTNERGETAERRLLVEDYDGEYVSGQSYDQNSQYEGYKRFRLDRINDSVVIR